MFFQIVLMYLTPKRKSETRKQHEHVWRSDKAHSLFNGDSFSTFRASGLRGWLIFNEQKEERTGNFQGWDSKNHWEGKTKISIVKKGNPPALPLIGKVSVGNENFKILLSNKIGENRKTFAHEQKPFCSVC